MEVRTLAGESWTRDRMPSHLIDTYSRKYIYFFGLYDYIYNKKRGESRPLKISNLGKEIDKQ